MNDWQLRYEQTLTTAEGAVQRIRSGDRVFLTGNCSVPYRLLDALVARAPALRDVEIVQVYTVGPAAHAAPDVAGHLRVNALFISDNVRQAVHEGRADFTPVFLHEIPGLFHNGTLPLDVALIHCSPPDRHGYCSYGVEVGLTKPAAEAARSVIAQINEQMPRTLGNSIIHVSRITHAVAVSEPLPEVPMGVPDATAQCIGQHVAELVPDGATLQVGIGAIPDAVLSHLCQRRDLGVHTELFSDGVMELMQAGVITNARKTLHRGKTVTGMVMGSRRLYDFVDDNPAIEFHPQDYVNDVAVIAQNDTMVSINSAIEVDLTGQVCADSIGHRLYSAVGGQVDFTRGAARARNGHPIIALPATALQGQVSRIVATLKPGAGVTTSRNDVHTVVTEYGVARLHGRTIRERAQALIAVAAPDCRDALCHEAHRLGYL